MYCELPDGRATLDILIDLRSSLTNPTPNPNAPLLYCTKQARDARHTHRRSHRPNISPTSRRAIECPAFQCDVPRHILKGVITCAFCDQSELTAAVREYAPHHGSALLGNVGTDPLFAGAGFRPAGGHQTHEQSYVRSSHLASGGAL